MTGKVLAICQSCAEHNKGEWKNPRATAPIFLGVCDCCKKVKPCTHIQYWKGIKPEGAFEVKNDAVEASGDDENAPSNSVPAAKPAAKAPAKKANPLGN